MLLGFMENVGVNDAAVRVNRSLLSAIDTVYLLRAVGDMKTFQTGGV